MPLTSLAPDRARWLTERNRQFYEKLWAHARLEQPQSSTTWPAVGPLAARAPRRLEIGPGLRPRIPLAGSCFIDLSPAAVAKLRARGASAAVGVATHLPFTDGAFDLAVACDVIEHCAPPESAFAELVRIVRPGGVLVFSVPLHPEAWGEFDRLVGHARRFRREEVAALIAAHDLTLCSSAACGSRPRSSRLQRTGLRWLARHPGFAMGWFNLLFRPIGRRLEPRLKFEPGWIDPARADGICVICGRAGASPVGRRRDSV
jgi:SAM-dependent methyltransferase